MCIRDRVRGRFFWYTPHLTRFPRTIIFDQLKDTTSILFNHFRTSHWGWSGPVTREARPSSSYHHLIEHIDSTKNIPFEEESTLSFDSASLKTPISDVSPKIDQVSKSRKKSICSQWSNRSIRPKNIDFQEKRIAPLVSAHPKTPISEVWSKIEKDSKIRPEAISSALSNRSIPPQISIFKKNEKRHPIQRPRKPPYPRFGKKSTKIRKVDQKRSVCDSRSDQFDRKYRFSRKTNTAIRFSALGNPHIRGFVENRQRFEKSTKIDQKIDKSIDSDRKISKFEKQRCCASSTFHKLSYEPKIMKFGSGVGELWLAEKSVTGGWTGLQRTFLPLFVKTNSLRSLRSLREWKNSKHENMKWKIKIYSYGL